MPIMPTGKPAIVQRETLVEESSHSGPIPAPEDFRAYNEVVPTAAERILRMAEEQAMHRRNMEQGFLELKKRDQGLTSQGQWMAVVVTVLAMGAGTLLICFGKSTEGLVAILLPLGGILGAFAWHSSRTPKPSPPASPPANQ